MAVNLTSSSRRRLNRITEGGEAEIFDYDRDTILKLYKPHVDLRRKQIKVEKFSQIHFPTTVVAPQESVFQDGAFIGYRMQKLSNTENLHQLVKPTYLKSAKLNNQDVLEMMVRIGATFNQLHKNGILVGDVSDYNILMNGKEIYFIDVDSWGANHLFSPDAYTEIFTDPKNYRANGSVDFSLEGEQYSFAVLTFNMLSRIHPFNGTYERDKNMSTLERMKQKISVCGKHSVIIPKMIPSWKWMSPELQEAYFEIFEREKRFDITNLLEEQYQNSKYCKVHQLYYYSKYTECPICNGMAKVIVAPQVIRTQTTNGPKVSLVFESQDVNAILNRFYYLSKDNFVVHIPTEKRAKYAKGTRMDFSENGEFLFVVRADTIQIWNTKNELISTLERSAKTPYLVKGNDLYYVDNGGMFSQLTVTPNGSIRKNLSLAYQPLFAVAESGETWLGSFYPKKAIIQIRNYNFELSYQGKIREYSIKQDPISKKWVFVYLTTQGKHRTVVFGDKKIEYDSDVIRYQATPLSGICFYNNTIYDPGAGKIIGMNYLKNQAKEFVCSVVSEDSKLQFDGRKFTIINEEKIYTFGG